MTPTEAARALAGPIGDLGSRFMLAPETFAHCGEVGFEPGFAYYVAGRFGVLGAVDADVVVAAAAFIEPSNIRTHWEQAASIASPAAVAEHFAGACSRWASANIAAGDGVERIDELAGRVVAAASPVAAPLFAGWRALPAPAEPVRRAYRWMHLMRELRFARHVVATASERLSPLESILSGGGAAPNAQMFGWPEPFPEPTSELLARRESAEALTDDLSAADLAVLDADERAELVRLVTAVELT